MKTEFELSKDSWHYKFYSKYNHWTPDNFCEYFWDVIRLIIKAFVSYSILAGLIIFFIALIITKPLEFCIGVLIMVCIVGGSIGVDKLKEKRRGIEKQPGFFKIKYISIKDKYCPMIKWIN